MLRTSFAHLLSAVTAVLLIGCASGSVGPKIGMEIPLSGANVEGSVTSSSTSPGFVGGLTFEGLFNRTWGFRSDLQIRTMSTEADFAGAEPVSDGLYSITGALNTSGTFVDVPVLVTFSPLDSTATVQPFFGVGACASFNTSVKSSASGTQTFTNSAGSTSGPFAQQNTASGISAPTSGWCSVVAFGGNSRQCGRPAWKDA